MSRGRFRSFVILVWSCLLLATAGEAAIRTAAVLEDREYVSLEEVSQLFHLRAVWRVPEKELQLTGSSARLDFTAERREIRINDMRVFLGDPILPHNGVFHVSRVDYETTLRPILNPRTRAGARPVRTIVIDPGHGGRDAGTRSPHLGLNEKDLTLAVSRRLKTVLEQTGYSVVLTRTDDTFVALDRRAALAAAAGADLFVSIHFNAVDNPEIVGTETYILTPQTQRSTGQSEPAATDLQENPGNAHDEANALLGFLVHRQLLRDLGSFDRGLKRARFQVLRLAECPAVLVEAGYLSNREEASRIATSEYQETLVRSLAVAIDRYRRATETVSAAEP